MSTAPKPLSRQEWLKTPYANSDARDPDRSISDLFRKYAVTTFTVFQQPGPSQRPGFGVRFVMGGLCYVIAMETLDVRPRRDERPVDPVKLLTQVKRAVYYTLKTALETSSVFISSKQLLLPFLESGGVTLYERMEPHLDRLQKAPPEHWQRLLPSS